MQEVLLSAKKLPTGGLYRYVRLNHMTSIAAQYVTITEIQITDTPSATNWCRQADAVASASGYYPGPPPQLPAGAIDGVVVNNPSNRWSSNASSVANDFTLTPNWFMVDLGQPRPFDSIQLAVVTGNYQDPVHFTIEGSVDGLEFTLIKEVQRSAYPNLVFTEVLDT